MFELSYWVDRVKVSNLLLVLHTHVLITSGKSALGNLILGCSEFKTGSGARSVTRECLSSSVVVHNRKITVTDTPGLFDTELSNEDISKELTRSYYEIKPGPHAFLIVTSGRYTTEADQALTLLIRLFGESVVNYCVVIVSHEDDLTYDGQHWKNIWVIQIHHFDILLSDVVVVALQLIQKQKIAMSGTKS